MRWLRVGTSLLGLLLLASSIGAALESGRSHSADRRDRGLMSAVQGEADRADEYFERSAALVRMLSVNPAFRDLYGENGGPADVPAPSERALAQANEALVFLESLYNRRIGEACVIDRSGKEIARATRGVEAEHHDLSPDEAKNPFFQPTFDLETGEVYQSRPYISPDTGEWVISNSTVVPFDDGVKRAIVHYEITMASFRPDDLGPGMAVLIVDHEGRVISDSRSPQGHDTRLGRPELQQFRSLAASWDDKGLATVGAERVAYSRVTSSDGNANRWFVVVSSSAAISLTSDFGGWWLVMLASSAALLLLATVTFAVYHRRLRRQAETDDLTGLSNRSQFHERAEQALLLARREGRSVGVLLLDLDDFKSVNDTLGHHRGDALLRELASRLKGAVRECDTVVRLGGDEFAVLLPTVDGIAGAVLVATRLIETITDDFELDAVPVHVGFSIGIAVSPDHGDDVHALLRHADVAMYEAKRNGLDFNVYSPDDDRYDTAKLAIVAELRTGIATGQMELHYQPKIGVTSGEIVGVEALVRWNHPARGLLQPADFIPVAEVTGLIRPLTRWVIGEGLAQLSRWKQQGLQLTLALNISARDLADPTFVPELRRRVQASDVNPSSVEVEITESSLMADPVRTSTALQELRSVGITVSVDDFGTGYSSLAYLRQLPVSQVKIDQTFIRYLSSNASDQSIVRSTIALGHSLGCSVVAEGVEEAEAMSHLRDMGCDLAQGYHLGRPMQADQISERMTSSTPTEHVPH